MWEVEGWRGLPSVLCGVYVCFAQFFVHRVTVGCYVSQYRYGTAMNTVLRARTGVCERRATMRVVRPSDSSVHLTARCGYARGSWPLPFDDRGHRCQISNCCYKAFSADGLCFIRTVQAHTITNSYYFTMGFI